MRLQPFLTFLPRHQQVAFVGKAGCGKSTSVTLIQRFYDVSAGRVLVDGKPIKSYDVHHLRRHIGVVAQVRWAGWLQCSRSHSNIKMLIHLAYLVGWFSAAVTATSPIWLRPWQSVWRPLHGCTIETSDSCWTPSSS